MHTQNRGTKSKLLYTAVLTAGDVHK